MSTLKVAAINNPSASSGGLAISTGGNVTGAGLDLIASQTFSAVSSVSLNNCFTSSYDNYVVQIALTGTSADGSLFLRLRSGGVDSTSASYFHAKLGYTSSAGSTNVAANASTEWPLLVLEGGTSDGRYGATIQLIGPAFASHTSGSTESRGSLSSTDGVPTFSAGGFLHVGGSVDGLSLIHSSAGTITGTLRVYGYRN